MASSSSLYGNPASKSRKGFQVFQVVVFVPHEILTRNEVDHERMFHVFLYSATYRISFSGRALIRGMVLYLDTYKHVSIKGEPLKCPTAEGLYHHAYSIIM